MNQPVRSVTLFSICFLFSLSVLPSYSQDVEINTMLMQTTFRIRGEGSGGTCFILIKVQPSPALVFVTAAHILENIQGQTAVITFRRQVNNTLWVPLDITAQIRRGDTPLWVQHPSADVAVAYLSLPPRTRLHFDGLSTRFLASDKTLLDLKIHPGDTLFTLGFPVGYSYGQGIFPILRSGTIATYPLLPTSETKTFLFDFEVFPGNSGGPVYGVFRGFRSASEVRVGGNQYILGLVSRQVGYYKNTIDAEPKRLSLAEVVHGSLIKETIDLLPPPGTSEAQAATIKGVSIAR